MRRKDREVKDPETVKALMNRCHCCRLGFNDNGEVYIVPLNFGWEETASGFVFYFHSAKEGHKIDSLKACDKACFTALGEPEKEPGDWWYHVKSVICFGRLREVTDPQTHDEKLRKFGGKYFPGVDLLEEEMRHSAHRAALLELTIEHCTGKRIQEK